VKLTNSDRSNLERFGCTLKEGSRVFYIDWKGRRVSQASNATVFACLSRIWTKDGPIVLLAFEISSNRPLPNYCYFPFDLKKQAHRQYLAQLTDTGEIKLCFLIDKKTLKRTHVLTPYLRLRSGEIGAEAIQEFETMDASKYNFDGAVLLMERHIRIPQLLDRLLLEDSLRELSEKVQETIESVPLENRKLAGDAVREAAEAFLPYYRNNRRAFLEILHGLRNGSTYVIDLHRMFSDDPGGITKFFSDALAASLSQRQLEALIRLVKFLVSLSKLFSKDQAPTSPTTSATSTELTPQIPDPPAALVTLAQSMRTSGISKDAASRFFELIGLKTGGKPGRPPRDYSREYELKASGLSWTDVARQMLRESAELREEFGGREFDSLSFEEQEIISHRIREGVGSYAERASKPFPIERAVPKGNSPDMQENK
jgi:hypothetical protein